MTSNKKIKKSRDNFIILIAVLFILLFVYYVSLNYSETTDGEENVLKEGASAEILEKIFDNSNEYLNEKYFSTLSGQEKNSIIEEVSRKVKEKCFEGEIDDDCRKDFLYFSLKTSSILDEDLTEESYEKIKEVYLNMKDDYKESEFTVKELHDFTLIFVVELCRLDFPGIDLEEERGFWNEKVIIVEDKSHWDDTQSQIFYFQNCIHAQDISSVEEKTGIGKATMEENVCNIIPGLSEVGEDDLCLINDYLKIKKFCEIKFSEEDKNLVNKILSKDYNTNYQKNCKEVIENFVVSEDL